MGDLDLADNELAQNVYECLFILDSNHYARDPGAAAQLIDKLINDAGGTMLVSRLWNEQRLAYPIDGHRKGTYWLAYFQMESGGITPLNRACRIHDTVLRQMVIKVEPRLVETLVSHAKGESIAEPAEREKPATEQKEATAAAESESENAAEPESGKVEELAEAGSSDGTES